jgi:hypothetical protein
MQKPYPFSVLPFKIFDINFTWLLAQNVPKYVHYETILLARDSPQK